MTSDCTFEQSTSCPQGSSMECSTGWGEVPLLPQNIWHNFRTAGFSGPGHMSTTICSDHRMGVPSSSPPMFQFASSSLCSALSPSISSSAQTPIHLQLDGTPQYFPGNCGSPAVEPGNPSMNIDYDVIRDHRQTDPDRGSISTMGTRSPVCFSVPQNSSNQHPPNNVSISNNAHSDTNHPSLEVQVPCVVSTPSVSVPPVSSVHGVTVANHTPGPTIPETLVLEEAPCPLPSPSSDLVSSTRSKRGKQGFNYKLSSSLPVTLK